VPNAAQKIHHGKAVMSHCALMRRQLMFCQAIQIPPVRRIALSE